MPLFISDEEYSRCSNDVALVAEKADSFIRDLYNELQTVKAQADAASITAEQTCSLLEQKYISLSQEFSKLESQNAQLNSSLQERLSELAQIQAEKHQLHLKSIEKDGEIERLSTEESELHKSKRQLLELLEHKDLEISEKNATIKSYLDKIVNLTDTAALREARLSDAEAELSRSKAACARLLQEKELIERHNVWLNDELTSKVKSLTELRRTHVELEADMSTKHSDVERRLNECSSSLKWNKERVKELEMKLTSMQQELCSSKDAAAANEQRLSAEIMTVNKLVELYKESSEEWSRKAGELEGVIKALETHLIQVENDYKERLEKEVFARKELEKEAADLKGKLEKCEAEMETSRRANELNLLPLSSLITGTTWLDSFQTNDMVEDNCMLVPKIPAGVSGTALAASLLRDGWSLAKMYSKYQEAVDALRHEQLGRKHSEAMLEQVLHEIEEKAVVILDERAEHERMVEGYSAINQKLQQSLSEQSNLDKTIQELKADLRRQGRDYAVAQKEIVDLEKQVTVLLKECRDIQLRCGLVGHDFADNGTITAADEMNAESNSDEVISERLLTFRDINGLVEQNVQLRSLVRSLSDQLEDKDMELKEKFELELKKHTDQAASKVAAVLERAEEQGRMIESLHTSVAMYKRLYEEEHKLHSSFPHSAEAAPENGRKDLMLLLEGSQEATKKAQEQAAERVRSLQEDLAKSRSEIISLRSERDKFALEANFARERLESFMKEFEHQRDEANGILARNVEFSQLIVNYQRKIRESSESLHTVEELSRKLTMEVSILKHEKEMLSNSEKRASDEVCSLSERVHRLQATLDTIHSTEEFREEARTVERRKQEEHIRQIEREWAEAKKELQEERDNVRMLTLDREQTIKNAMRQVEEMGKELAKALQAVAAAEARAAVAEARYSDLEKKLKSSETKVVEINGECGPSSSSAHEAVADLHIEKEEIEKLKEEAQANKAHMLQYKSIAEVNEAALKQMEYAHENFRIEADKLKKSLEAEVMSLRERVSELENEAILKSKEAASTAAGNEEALASALAEIGSLKEENSIKMSQIAAIEIQISALKDDLENEHRRWRSAQDNYERQVILQSETIQELTKTSQALALLQKEASELRKLADAKNAENNELKGKWEVEKSMLEVAKNEAEKKYDEINEQNKILHSRLEALHIKLAEKDRRSVGISSSSGLDPLGDAGLQNVINYLRRSKEIAETEISLLKQEKLRLQSQLESALKATETAQASLHAERANSRTLLFTEEEIKSLQLQVREMNLLRESNMQIREENKHNFEECQKLREVAQKARIETENLEVLLRESQTEVETCKKEIEMQRTEKDQLEKRVGELLEQSKNIDVEDYERMKHDFHQMQINLREKDAQIEEMKRHVSEKQDRISKLEQDIANSRLELSERENKINDILQAEANMKAELEKQKKVTAQLKKRLEALSREKEELSKENQALSKQLEDYKQGKRSIGDVSGEQAMKEKEKEKEKDSRLQTLEKALERQREEYRKERDDHRMEKAKRLKTEKTIVDSIKNVNQEKAKLVDELEKHKLALKRVSDELEKLKHAKGNLPEGTSVVQLLSGPLLDDLAAAYALTVENFEKLAHSVFSELGARALQLDPSSTVDTSSSAATTGLTAPAQPPSILTPVGPATSYSPAKAAEEREKRSAILKTNAETRKTGRKLVRPRLVKSEEPQGDVDMAEIEGPNNGGKPAPSQDTETQTLPPVRKRLASSSTSDLQEETQIQGETTSDVAPPVLKRSRGSDSPQEAAEGQAAASLENLETLRAIEESFDAIADLPQGSNEEAIDVEKEEAEISEGQTEEPKEPAQVDGTSEVELPNERASAVEEVLVKPIEREVVFDDGPKDQAEQDIQPSMIELGSEKEEGELDPDVTDIEGGGDMCNITGGTTIGEGQPETVVVPVTSPAGGDEEGLVTAAVDIGDINSPEILNDEKTAEGDVMEEVAEGSDKSNDGNEQIAVETDQTPEAAMGSESTSTSTSTVVDVGVSKQGSPTVPADPEEVKQALPVGSSSTTINLQERARQRAMLRQAGVLSPSVGRGRGRAITRGRGVRGGRGRAGRGQSSGDQG